MTAAARAAAFAISLCLSLAVGGEGAGMVSVRSAHGVAATADRLEAVIAEKGLSVFSRIDHAAGAASVGESLRPTVLVLFGSPKVGTGLMSCAQSTGIDLPMKMLVWEDAAGAVWLAYNATEWLAGRHDLDACGALLERVSGVLAGMAASATAP